VFDAQCAAAQRGADARGLALIELRPLRIVFDEQDGRRERLQLTDRVGADLPSSVEGARFDAIGSCPALKICDL
jgi:hypothetical protein